MTDGPTPPLPYYQAVFYVISGASGSGKTTLLPLLRQARPDISWHDFDELWTSGGKLERQHLTERWVQLALTHDGHFGLLGQCPLGEILCAPSADKLDGVRHLLLDLGDVERVIRLRIRDGEASQEMLNWAAWLRLHHALPDWRTDVLTEGGWSEMHWERWLARELGPEDWPTQTLDLGGLSPQDCAEAVLARL